MEAIKQLPLDEHFTGVYGESRIPEQVLQKVWLKQDFSKVNLRTLSGKALRIKHPGAWNKLEGPDFKRAEIEIEDQRFYGDVEVHFHAQDWHAHVHEKNSNYSNVVLHVVLFEPNKEQPLPYNEYGYCPEVLVLLDKMYCSIEEYAAEEALLEMENCDPIAALEGFLLLPEKDQWMMLRDRAKERWRQKRGFAFLRLKKHQLEEALHISVLEILGYKRNRGVMSDLALRYPKPYFMEKGPLALFEEFQDDWILRGVRPQNYPLKRLHQYASVLTASNQYHEHLLKIFNKLPIFQEINTARFRKNNHLSSLRTQIQSEAFADAIGGTRLDTLIIDGLLPLFSALLNQDFFDYWFHWYSGDIPSCVTQVLKTVKISDVKSNGLNQGILQMILQAGLIS